MDIITSFAIIVFAALIHASFQLSVSVLTLLSGHAIGAKKSRSRVFRMTTGYVFGAGFMTLLLLSTVSLAILHFFGTSPSLLVWAISSGLVLGIGVAVWLFYYRKGRDGTELWIPRVFARYLTNRSKKAELSAEAFGLGLTSVIAEILFILPSLVISALVIIELPSEWQFLGIIAYTLISLSTLFIVWSLVSGRRSLGRLQKWRTDNKRFLQFAAGSALIVLGFFVYVTKIMAAVSGAA